jgi:hypothetical protein
MQVFADNTSSQSSSRSSTPSIESSSSRRPLHTISISSKANESSPRVPGFEFGIT